MKNISNSFYFQILVYIASWAAHILIFFTYYPRSGSGGILGLAIIPISLAGLFWGLKTAVPLGLVGLVLNSIILSLARGSSWQNLDLSTTFDIGNIALLFAMVFITKYQNLAQQLRHELIEKSQTEAALQESRTTLLTLMDATDETAMLIDPRDGIIQTINKSGSNRLNQTPMKLVGKSIFELLPEEIAQTRIKYYKQAALSAKPVHFEDQTEGIQFLNSVFPVLNRSGEVEKLAVYSHDVTLQKHTEELLKTSLLEKEILLQEIHHRVKNNLQVISSLTSLQAGEIQDPIVLQLFKSYKNRIQSIALLHDFLYDSKNLSEIDIKGFIEEIVFYLVQSYSNTCEAVDVSIETNDITLDSKNLVPCGLIITELVSNALKYAFPKDAAIIDPCIQICFEKTPENKYRLIHSDNGIGLADDFSLEEPKSLGIRLVNMMTKQINGSLELVSGAGTKYIIVFDPV